MTFIDEKNRAMTPEVKDVNHGQRNLLLLGTGALLVTVATTCLSLWVYRTSGDIYLDRSRPGYLPDKEEVEQESEVNSSYVFSETGELTQNELTEYLKELKVIDDRIKALSDPYDATPLSDESLGISQSTPTAEDQDKTAK